MNPTDAVAPLERIVDPAAAAFAAEVGPEGPVVAEGGRTRWLLGGPPSSEARLVRAPSGVIDYQPEEMIIRVRAGTTVSDLDATLAEGGQRSALPCRSPEATVGGALAIGQNHLDVLGRGRVRDSLLQVTYVSAEGRLITGGGPTVKNVSGFNLPRVIVGSLGCLGLIAEVILRVNPLPACDRWVRLRANPATVAAQLLRPAAMLTDGESVWVHLEGHGVDVDTSAEALAAVAEVTEVEGPPDLPPHRWSLSPAQILDRRLDEWGAGPYVASVAVGTVWADAPQPVPPLPTAIQTVSDRLKRLFDPTGRLAPGRSLPGLVGSSSVDAETSSDKAATASTDGAV